MKFYNIVDLDSSHERVYGLSFMPIFFGGTKFSFYCYSWQVYFVAKQPGVDMIQKSYFQKLLTVQKKIETMEVEYTPKSGEKEMINLDSLCFKPISGKGCLIECKYGGCTSTYIME